MKPKDLFNVFTEIRRVRHAISAEIGHDPRRISAYYAKLQAELKDRIINRSGEKRSDDTIESPHDAE